MSRYRKLSLDSTRSLFAPVATPIGGGFQLRGNNKRDGKEDTRSFRVSDIGRRAKRESASPASTTTVTFSRAVIGKQRLFPARVLLVSVSLLRREASLCSGYLITRCIDARERMAAAPPARQSSFLIMNSTEIYTRRSFTLYGARTRRQILNISSDLRDKYLIRFARFYVSIGAIPFHVRIVRSRALFSIWDHSRATFK